MTSWLRLVRAPADPLRFLTDLSRAEGDVARVRLGPVEAWLLSHPNDVEQVLADSSGRLSKGKGVEGPKRLLGEGLLTSEGDVHDRQRPLVERAFDPATLEAVATPEIVRLASTLASGWEAGQTVDAFEEMSALALSVAVRVILGEDAGVRRDVAAAFDAFDRLTLPFVAPLARLPLASNRRFKEAKAAVDGTVKRLITARRAEPQDDLLSILVESGMPDGAVRDEVMNLFSGHKSVAVALTWALYLLAQHPDALESADARLVLAEAMRLYPPVWVLVRKVERDRWTAIDGTAIRRGATLVVSAWVTHRDGRLFEGPEDFVPDRFRAETAARRPRFSYFPFGGGPRSCVGEPLAWLEGATVLTVLAERWRFRLAPGQTVELAPRVTLKPKRGVPLVLDRRS